MSYMRDTAIILRRTLVRERDVTLTLFGKNHGKQVVLARGTRTWGAKQAGHLQPLNEVEVMLAHGQYQDKLAVVESRQRCPALRTHLEFLVLSGVACDLVDRLTVSHDREPEIYLLLHELRNLGSALTGSWTPLRARLVLAAVSLRLLSLSGSLPSLARCVGSCRKTLTEPVFFISEADGFICVACQKNARSGPKSFPLAPHGLACLRFLVVRPLREVLALTGAREVLESVCECTEQMLHRVPFARPFLGVQILGSLTAPA